MMMPLMAALVAALAAGAPAAPPAAAAEQALKNDLVRIVEEIHVALQTGDRAVWEKRMAEDFLLVDRDGSTRTREDLLKELAPVPAAVKLKLEVVDPRVQDLGTIAVLIYTTREHEEIWGQTLNVDYRNTMVFARRDGAWRLVTWQYVEVPKDGAPVIVPVKALEALEGEYEAAAGTTVTIARRGEKLFARRGERPEAELIPLGETVFHTAGTEFDRIFVKDADGKITGFLDRRKGSDTFWRKVR